MVIGTIQRDTKIMECSICLQEVEIEDNADLECGHPFHIECVKQMHDTLCPSCRAYMKSNKLNDEDLHRMESRHSRDIRESDEQIVFETNRSDNAFRNVDRLARELRNLFVELHRMSDFNLWRDERRVNYMACKLEDALGIEIGYVNPHDVQRAKGIQFRYLNMLGTDIERIQAEIASLRMMS